MEACCLVKAVLRIGEFERMGSVDPSPKAGMEKSESEREGSSARSRLLTSRLDGLERDDSRVSPNCISLVDFKRDVLSLLEYGFKSEEKVTRSLLESNGKDGASSPFPRAEAENSTRSPSLLLSSSTHDLLPTLDSSFSLLLGPSRSRTSSSLNMVSRISFARSGVPNQDADELTLFFSFAQSNLPKLITQVTFTYGKIIGKAFVQAGRQAYKSESSSFKS